MKGPEDDAGLTGKVAIVSGGGAAGDGIGNGRAAAILLARAGTRVVVADLDMKVAERTVDMIKAAECKRLVDAAVDRWGRLDFLDNNIGIGSRGSVVDEKPDEYRRVMQVNVETMFLLSKHAIPAMIKTAKGGSIVNISSISALRPRGLTTYTTSKAAVIGLSRAMAVDHGCDNIRPGVAPDWLKIKTAKRQEVVIAGFTAPRRTRPFFGALVLAVREDDTWRYIGHVGTGFSHKVLEDLHAKLVKLTAPKSPFPAKVKDEATTTWVRPSLVAEVKFAEWTSKGELRQPVYLGLRSDKRAKDVVRERERSRQ